jgi:hypothetical protein
VSRGSLPYDPGPPCLCPCGRPRICKMPDGRWMCGVCLRADNARVWWDVLIHKATWTYEVASAYMARVIAEQEKPK